MTLIPTQESRARALNSVKLMLQVHIIRLVHYLVLKNLNNRLTAPKPILVIFTKVTFYTH